MVRIDVIICTRGVKISSFWPYLTRRVCVEPKIIVSRRCCDNAHFWNPTSKGIAADTFQPILGIKSLEILNKKLTDSPHRSYWCCIKNDSLHLSNFVRGGGTIRSICRRMKQLFDKRQFHECNVGHPDSERFLNAISHGTCYNSHI